jgi:hypothetical protein
VTTIRLALGLGACTIALASLADASVLCRTRARAVVERTTCLAREVPIARGALGAQSGVEGPAGPTGPVGAPGRQAASIVDAAGTRVGPVIYLSPLPAEAPKASPIAYALFDHPAVGGTAQLGVDADGAGGGAVAYTGAGCTGTALVPIAGFFPILQIVHEAVFHPTTAVPPTVVKSVETANHSSSCTTITPNGGCCRDQGNPSPSGGYAVAERTTLTALGLRAPFSARAE